MKPTPSEAPRGASALLVFVVFALLSGTVIAGPLAEHTPALDAFVTEVFANKSKAGLSIGIQLGDEQWTSAYGFANIAAKKRATPRTSYRMASVTKIFTAVAILQLVEKGRVNLDAEVQRYIPEFPRKPWPIKVRHLLGHLSGIGHYFSPAEEHITEPYSTAQSLALFANRPLESPPAERYVYTSYGFNLLGAIIERVSGVSYGEYLRRHVFRPAKMKNSEMDDPVKAIPRRAVGYRYRRGKIVKSEFVDISSRFAGGGTRSTVEDMLRFGNALLGDKLLQRDSLHKMTTSMWTSDGKLTRYGMGVGVYPLAGRLVVAHAGSQPETSTLLFMLPADGLVLALASNLEDQWNTLYRVAAYVTEQLLNDGVKRRGVQAQGAVDDVMASGMMSIFGWGLSHHRFHGRYDANPGKLLRAFAVVDVVLDPRTIEQDIFAAMDDLQRGAGPSMDNAFSRVGAHMAAVLERVKGAEALAGYHTSGPVPFFADYIEACAKTDCPPGLTFGPAIQDAVARYVKGWERAYPREIQQIVIDEETDPLKLQVMLEGPLLSAPVRPAFGGELGQIGLLRSRAGHPEGLALLELGRRLFPRDVELTVSLAEGRALAGDTEGAAEMLRAAAGMPGSKRRTSVAYLKYRALVLKREGHAAGGRALLDATAQLMPASEPIHTALAKAKETEGDIQGALAAYRVADAVGPSRKKRRAHMQQLKRRLAPKKGGEKR